MSESGKKIRDADGVEFSQAFVTTPGGNFATLHQIMGSNGEVDMRGLIAARPAATAVPIGQTYWAIDRIGQTDEFTVSDGSNWKNV